MKVFAIGSSIVSSYWNGAATYYRGIYRALAALGHAVTFAEPDAYDRQKNRDDSDYSFVTSLIYQSPQDLAKVIAAACDADLVIKHSGVGVDDEWLERETANLRCFRRQVAFWDVDAPATLSRLDANPHNPFLAQIPRYDFIFTYGGGSPVVEHYMELGARNCYPIYNALDPQTHYPVEPKDELRCDLAFVGHRLPDREARVEQFFLTAAALAPEMSFLLGGAGWENKKLPRNVRWIGHIGSRDHNAVNCSTRMVLNINRDSMAQAGFSPPTRIFEAAGAGACVITDAWRGIEEFFHPDEEILTASSAEDIVHHLRTVNTIQTRKIGDAMRRRALRDHAYELRARQVNGILSASQIAKSAA